MLYFCNHCDRLKLHNWNVTGLVSGMVSTYSHPAVDCDASETVVCGDLLTCGDFSLVFFSLLLYFTEKLHCVIPEG